ncbi:MAG TPA: HAMP domain-containing sensor histidine kinase, partial [Chitinophagaceae bacterium]|nr:HAMP domain-containing sensor histidine kinase [Chitinophagaceae bacterium]
SGSFQLEKTNIDVHVIIQKVANTFKLIVENKDGSIKLNLNAENPSINADEIHLTNVLYNLLDNAIKYCSRPPEILISTTDRDTGLNITVKDNGIGMTSKTQQYIFEKFYRVETGDVHNVKGFGLGLSYVKSIIDAHKGSIYINSKLNSGSEFSLFFPSL